MNDGDGEPRDFENAEEFLKFLKTNKKAAYLWTDAEDLHAIANLYQINIKIISIQNENDTSPRVSDIGPDEELKPFISQSSFYHYNY